MLWNFSHPNIITLHECYKKKKEYYLLYKPGKTVSSVKDDKDRDTVVSLIPSKSRIYPIGRLDYNTTGLLLLTNDGELTNILTHPSHEVEKIYSAKIEGILTPSEFMKLKKGIVLGNIDGQDFAIATGKLSNELSGIINNNETANYIFTLLQKEQTVNSSVSAMSARYDAPKEEIEKDVADFIETLDGFGVLEK